MRWDVPHRSLLAGAKVCPAQVGHASNKTPRDHSFDGFARHEASVTEKHNPLDLGGSALAALIVGLVVGALVAILELNPRFNYHTALYLSFPSGSVGIWAILVVVIASLSPNGRQAAVRTGCFLAGVVTIYYIVRFANYSGNNYRIIQSMSEVMSRKSSAIQGTWWTQSRILAIVVSYMACLLGAIVAWGIARFSGTRHYWLFASIPIFLLVFEGWSYFVPMALYVHINYVPAVVDVVGALAVTWILVQNRQDAQEAQEQAA